MKSSYTKQRVCDYSPVRGGELRCCSWGCVRTLCRRKASQSAIGAAIRPGHVPISLSPVLLVLEGGPSTQVCPRHAGGVVTFVPCQHSSRRVSKPAVQPQRERSPVSQDRPGAAGGSRTHHHIPSLLLAEDEVTILLLAHSAWSRLHDDTHSLTFCWAIEHTILGHLGALPLTQLVKNATQGRRGWVARGRDAPDHACRPWPPAFGFQSRFLFAECT